MKYALESIPELIGEQDFKDLCLALGFSEYEPDPTGVDLASRVRGAVIKAHRDEVRRQMQSSVSTKELFAKIGPSSCQE